MVPRSEGQPLVWWIGAFCLMSCEHLRCLIQYGSSPYVMLCAGVQCSQSVLASFTNTQHKKRTRSILDHTTQDVCVPLRMQKFIIAEFAVHMSQWCITASYKHVLENSTLQRTCYWKHANRSELGGRKKIRETWNISCVTTMWTIALCTLIRLQH